MSIKKIKMETHMHTYPTSCDSEITAENLIKSMEDNNIDAAILTNHYDLTQLNKFLDMEDLSIESRKCVGCDICKFSSKRDKYAWDKFNQRKSILYDKWFNSVEYVIKLAARRKRKIFMGMEYSILGSQEHISILGVSLEEFRDVELKPEMDLERLRRLFPEAVLIQNHPGRYSIPILPYSEVDGYEIINTKIKAAHHLNSDIVSSAENLYGEPIPSDKMLLAGSDAHRVSDVGNVVIALPYMPSSEHELVLMLKEHPRPEILYKSSMFVGNIRK